MDPKLRPSFTDIVKTLEEILSNLKREEDERERMLLNLDVADRKPISVSKGRIKQYGHKTAQLAKQTLNILCYNELCFYL